MTTKRTITWLASGLLWLVGDVSGRNDHPKGFQSNIVGMRYFPMKADFASLGHFGRSSE